MGFSWAWTDEASSPVRGEAARFDEGHLDSELADFLAETIAEAFQGPLGGVVQADARECCNSADAGHLEDVAAFLLAKIGQGCLRDPQGAEEVSFHLGAGLRLGDFFYRPEKAIACIVDDHVQPSKVIVRMLDRGKVRLAVRNVQLDGQDIGAVFAHKYPSMNQCCALLRQPCLRGQGQPLPIHGQSRAMSL